MPTTNYKEGKRMEQAVTNTIGMLLIPISPGSFVMGGQTSIAEGWYEKPAHSVKITSSFYISETEVTLAQFRKFRPDFVAVPGSEPYVSGVSWHDAVAFCEWLSRAEGNPYRLPTEAEWEYTCRAGSTSLFWSGDARPELGQPNPWGLKNLHGGVREWCLDWYSDYPSDGGDQLDPVGPADGMARVVRGGGLDNDEAQYAHSASRAGIAPDFGWQPGMAAQSQAGQHRIGFRLVQGALPKTRPVPSAAPFALACIKQTAAGITKGPEPSKPWYHRRYLLPTPPENVGYKDYAPSGIQAGVMRHNHSPALEVCPNGDLLLVIYTSAGLEYEPEVGMIASRLRYGSDEWDMPERAFDFPGVNDHAPCLWRDKRDLHLFWGCPNLPGGYPFNWMSSKDSGATWSDVKFPKFNAPVGPHARQPIATAFRGADGAMYLSSDGAGQTSVLWSSRDNGKSWQDAGAPNVLTASARPKLADGMNLTDGRSAGRHTAYVMLKDGSILGMGGKNTDIDGHMPKAISKDGGKTWTVSKTPFHTVGGNQRPCIVRLQSGRLFFSTDMHSNTSPHTPDIKMIGAVVALSDDEGQTWTIKLLPGTLAHESGQLGTQTTLGYSVARQADNGIIHLITTMNSPCLHFELNEAWILSESAGISQHQQPKVTGVRKYKESSRGSLRADWSAGTADDGRYLLDGRQVVYYPNGRIQWEAVYKAGVKVGDEHYNSPDGKRIWAWRHHDDGTNTWSQWWPNGQMKCESTWRDMHCEGLTRTWDVKGKLVNTSTYTAGRVTSSKGKGQ